jgi:hypothetical protein
MILSAMKCKLQLAAFKTNIDHYPVAVNALFNQYGFV